MIQAIIPAAGRSQRMQGLRPWPGRARSKLLLPWGEGTVIGTLTERLRDGGVDRAAVVTSPEDEDLARWCADAAPFALHAVNAEPGRGMLSSINAGLQALGDAAHLAAAGSPILVCPGDHPALAAATVAALLACAAELPGRALVPTYQGKRGHPLLLPAELLAEIPRLDPDVGLRRILEPPYDSPGELPVDDPGILANLNTPADYTGLAP